MGIGNALQTQELEVVVHNHQTIPQFPKQLGGLFFLPSPCQAIDAFRWLRAASEPLRRARGLLRLLIGPVAKTDHGIEPEPYAIGGLIKTARHEWPEASCRILEFDNGTSAENLVDACLSEGPVETQISPSGATALCIVNSPLPSNARPLDIRPGALVIVTGGARGVTAEATLSLAQAYQPTLLLLGRSPAPVEEPSWLRRLGNEADIKRELLSRAKDRTTPRQLEGEYQRVLANREIISNLRRFEAAGAMADYRTVDVRDALAMESIINDARQKYGPVHGLIHGSGVLADKKIEEKTDEQFRNVFETKVTGLESLLTGTKADPLQFIALFSSSTGRFGRTGQCDYAAANEYLNAIARRLNCERPNCRTVAVNWGPWDGGMVTPTLRKVFADEGVGLIPVEQGGPFLVDELSSPDPQPEVVVLGPPPSQPSQFALSLETVSSLRDHVMDGNAVLPVALAINYLAEAAVRRFPGHGFVSCTGLQVLHPVFVPEGRSASIQIFCDEPLRIDGETAIPARLQVEGKTCYRANVVLAELAAIDRHVESPSPTTAADCYGSELFHGPSWQGISKINSINDAGVEITAYTAPLASSWVRDGAIRNWHVDPLLVDCVLQAIIVFTQRQFGLPSLPVAIGQVRLIDRIDPGVFTVHIRVTHAKLPVVRAEAAIIDTFGRTVAELKDCEHVCTETLKRAFDNNGLSAKVGE